MNRVRTALSCSQLTPVIPLNQQPTGATFQVIKYKTRIAFDSNTESQECVLSPGGQQEGERRVVHHVQGEQYQRLILRV